MRTKVWLVWVLGAVCAGVWTHGAPADWSQRPIENSGPTRAALPVRYGFDRLRGDLNWAQAAVAAKTLVEAHAEYTRALDSAWRECVELMALTPKYHARVHWDCKLAPSDRDRLRRHQERMDVLAANAELALLSRLAGVAIADPLPPEFQRLKEWRDLERLIESAQRRAGHVEISWDMPVDMGAEARARLAEACDVPEVRAAVVAAMEKHAATRTAAWTKWRTEAQATSMAELAAQYERPPAADKPGQGRAIPERKLIALTSNGALFRVEADFAADMLAALPAKYRGALLNDTQREHGSMVCLLMMPGQGAHKTRNPRELARLVLALPSLSTETRAAARELLAKWVAEDDALTKKQFADSIASFQRNEQPRIPESRRTQANAQLAALAQATGQAWLTGAEYGLAQDTELLPLSAADQEVFGVDLPQYVPDAGSAADVRAQQAGMAPSKWQRHELEEVLNLLRLTEAQRTVADQVIADAASDWAARVEPTAAALRAAVSAKNSGMQKDARVEAVKRLVALQPDRRAAWKAAQEIDLKMVQGIREALGKTDPQGRQLLDAVELSHVFGAPIASCMALRIANRGLDDPIRALIELRGTAEECAAMRQALCGQEAKLKQDAARLLGECLDLQDEQERVDVLQEEWKPQAGQPTDVAKMQEAGAAHEEVKARAKSLGDSVRALQAQLHAALAPALSPAMAQRMTHGALLGGVNPFLCGMEEPRVRLLASLSKFPDSTRWTQRCIEVFNAELDPCDAWAAEAVQEGDRQLAKNDALVRAGRWALQPRESVCYTLVGSSRLDAIARALCLMAAELPPEVADAIPQLAKYR